MHIIYRYLIKEIVKYICMILLVAVGIYVAVDFFEKIDNFLNAGLPITRAMTFFILNTPFIVSQLLPVCMLISILVVFGLMARNNELLALRSSGAGTGYFVKPVVGIGMVVAIFHIIFCETIVPIASQKANKIWRSEVKKESTVISKENNIWLKENQMILHIKHFNPMEQAIYGITIYFFDQGVRLIRRLDASKGVFKENRWIFTDIMEQRLGKNSDESVITFHDLLTEPIQLLPENLRRVVKKPSEMNFKELSEYIQKIREEGYDPTIYQVDLHSKIAFPLICAVMSLMGLGIAVKTKMKEGLPMSIAYGLGTAFLYWICYSFCISLGYGELFPPVIAAWLANIIFLIISCVLLITAD